MGLPQEPPQAFPDPDARRVRLAPGARPPYVPPCRYKDILMRAEAQSYATSIQQALDLLRRFL
jgi:hypothetical protein